jgi:hypothetical protein
VAKLRTAASITCSKLGFGNNYKKNNDLIKSGKTAALRHTKKDLSKLSESLKILKEIIDFASRNNILPAVLGLT